MEDGELSALEAKLGEWRVALLIAGAYEAGVFSALEAGPAEASELAATIGGDARAVWIVLEALVDAGFLERVNEAYTFTQAGRSFLADESSPSFAIHSVVHMRNMMSRWLELAGTIRSGEPASRLGPPADQAHFIGSMKRGARAGAAAVVDACLARRKDARTVLDAGGGPGIHAREFARRGLSVTVLDLPEVVDMARRDWGDEGIAQLVAGDFNEGLPPGPFDVIFLGNVTHIYGPEENLALFKRARQSLSPDGVATILDMVRGRSPRAAIFAVNMLTATRTGGTWTEDQYRSWLHDAGYRDVQIKDIDGRDRQVITAEC